MDDSSSKSAATSSSSERAHSFSFLSVSVCACARLCLELSVAPCGVQRNRPPSAADGASLRERPHGENQAGVPSLPDTPVHGHARDFHHPSTVHNF